MKLAVTGIALALGLVAPPIAVAQSRIIEGSVETDLVSGPVEYAVLLPKEYREDGDRLPLLLSLHGDGGNRDVLAQRQQALFDELWADGSFPPVVVATPSANRSVYMNARNGDERWEDFMVDDFLSHLGATYRVRTDREGLLLTGASMGGTGSLLLGFKHPDRFAAVAALEPGIRPVLSWDEVRPKHFLSREDMEPLYGWPVDRERWAANNPASIIHADPDTIRDSGLQIYVEAGDQDVFWLYEGAEFLHQTLWDAKIPHEYHLVRGADHVGATLERRRREALRFLGRVLAPPPPDNSVTRSRLATAPMKRGLAEDDHYGLDAAATARATPPQPPAGSPQLLRVIELRFPTRGEVSLRDARTYVGQTNLSEYVSRPNLDRWVPFDDAEPQVVDDAERLWKSGQFESVWVDAVDAPWENGVAGRRVIFSFVEREDVRVPTAAYPPPPPEYQQPPEGHERLYPPPAG